MTPRRALRFAPLLAPCIALAAASPLAQRSQPLAWQVWLDAVNTHIPGERDEAVVRVAPWSRGILDDATAPLLHSPTPVEQLRIVERALVLHVDIAILHRAPGGYDLPALPGAADVTLIEDGRAIGQMSRTVHWAHARGLLERLPAGRERTRIARQFYRAAGAVLQRWGEYPELTTHLSDGRDLLGEDAALLLYEGTMHQAYAGPRLQRFFDERRRSQAAAPATAVTTPRALGAPLPNVSELPPAFPSIRDSRERAERLFRRALTIDPALVEARIRLAHVLADGGRHAAALAELALVPAGPLPPLLDYYASLIKGRETRALGRLDAARAAFERAVAIYPNSSAGRFGLSELAMTQGNRAESLAQLIRGNRLERIDEDEPWWWLDRRHDPSAEDLVAGMRRMAPP